MDWVDYLKISDFQGIFARDSPEHLHQTGCCVINLDDGVGKGTHWVASFIKSIILILFHYLHQWNLWIMRGDLE